VADSATAELEAPVTQASAEPVAEAPVAPPVAAPEAPAEELAATTEEGAPEAPVAVSSPIIIKKVMADGHGGAHGGAWKIALADMMTAMMAFFSADVAVGRLKRGSAQEHRRLLSTEFAK